ncbi:MAG TPA: hypothetical protein VF998_01050 [Candidatus Limnocylindria bacterium]
MKRLIAVATLAVTLALSNVALATTTYNDAVFGYEIYATSTTGVFTGKAGGDLPGNWFAVVNHTTPLPAIPSDPPATITAGSYFILWTSIGGEATNVTGTFAPGGTVAFVSQAPGCGSQTYSVVGSFSGLLVDGVPAPGSGGTFAATLTHYRAYLFGRCRTLAATVVGAVSLTF